MTSFYSNLIMTYFTNPNFIDHIIQSKGAQSFFDYTDMQTLNTLIQFQTRHILQTAFKFMIKENRYVIQLQDINNALIQKDHSQMIVHTSPVQDFNEKEKQEKVYRQQQLLEELQMLANLSLSEPKLHGNWIFVNGKIPITNQNMHLKSLSQIIYNKQHEKDEKKKIINIIKDNPYALLTKQQAEYFQNMCMAINQNINPQGTFTVDGDLNNLLPFFLKFLGQGKINQTGIWFLLKVIDNKYIWVGIEYYLKKILNLLLSYKGIHSFEVGAKIAQLVDRFSDKYPILRDIYVNYKDQSYSTILKKIPFELQLGIPFEVDQKILAKCKEDSQNDDLVAIQCMKALLSYSSQLKLFKDFLVKQKNTYVYWHPCPQLKNDPYLRMF